MGFAKLFLLLLVLSAFNLDYSIAESFNCSSQSSCNALVGYITVDNTNLEAIQSLFDVKSQRRLLGANNLPLSTASNTTIPAQGVVKVPINCACYNNTGTSSGAPIYTVREGDGLSQIADDVFSRLVTFQQIAAANGIANHDLITPAKELEIPLPCSCDEVDGERVVHYAHMVKPGSSLEEIAREFGTDEKTLAAINGIEASNELKADQPIDVPLKGSEGLLSLGNTTTSGCNRSACSYAGFNNSTIFTSLVHDYSCSK